MCKFLRSFEFAFKGLKSTFKSEFNFKIHLIACVIVTIFGFYFQIKKYEWLAISICIGIVLTAELFNTAIEKLVDIISPEYNVKAGQIKDIAAGAVLISAITSLICCLVIFIPRFF